MSSVPCGQEVATLPHVIFSTTCLKRVYRSRDPRTIFIFFLSLLPVPLPPRRRRSNAAEGLACKRSTSTTSAASGQSKQRAREGGTSGELSWSLAPRLQIQCQGHTLPEATRRANPTARPARKLRPDSFLMRILPRAILP